MSRRIERHGEPGWRGAVAAMLLLNAIHFADRLPKPELHMRLEVALLVGSTGFAVALIR